ncbi:MAG: PIN domain-containing protein [Planctomycetota bacterium]|nr:PIN domain-containing protein [Planctomycetota bacterium]
MMTFVDTGVWFASIVPTDPRHGEVADWHRVNNLPLLTTDYVVDETLTLLRARGERTRAIELGRSFFDLDLFAIHRVDEQDLHNAWRSFREQPDRLWSFTDCTSKAVIERLHIKRALTFDRHFVEFGVSAIVP